MAANDPTPPAPLFDRQNVIRGSVQAALSGGALAATLYAPRWPIPCAIIALVIVVFAGALNISLVRPAMVTPTVRIVGAGVTIQRPEPLAASDQEIVTSAPVTTVAVDVPPVPAIGHRVVPDAPAQEMPAPPVSIGGLPGIDVPAPPVKRSRHSATPVVTPVDLRSDS